jgi:hypothetical protein
MPTLAGFVDHGYLRAEGARALKLDRKSIRTDASEVVQWIKTTTRDGASRFLRVYWYDGAFDPRDPRRASQEQF